MNRLVKFIKNVIPMSVKNSLYSFVKNHLTSTGRELKKIAKKGRFISNDTNIFGLKFKYVDSASFVFIYKEIFQKEIYKFSINNSNPYIIDCGANIGLSVLYFKRIYPQAHIVAFEPDFKIFETLSENVRTFNLKDVLTVNKAVWSSETELDFYSDGSDGGRIKNNEMLDSKVQKVKTTTLSNYLNRPVDLLKIDIEGAELEVLKSIKDQLQNVTFLFIEYHSFVNSKQLLNELLEILVQCNFRYYIEHIGVKSNHPFDKINSENGMDNQLNIFAKKNI